MSKLEKDKTVQAPLLKVLLIYNDFLSAAKANAALRHLGKTSDTSVIWEIRPWRMDMLKFPPLADEALADARDAQLLVFVGQCASVIPFWLEDWLEDWAGSRQFPDAVLAVINAQSVNLEWLPVSQQLSEFAGRHHLEVLYGNPGSSDDVTVLKVARNDTEFRTNNLTEPIFREVSQGINRGWGLNE